MAYTITPDYDGEDFLGAKTRKVTVRFLGDTSYPTGGYSSIKSKFGLTKVDNVIAHPRTTGACVFFLRYDKTNDKMLVFSTVDGTQKSNTSDVSAADFDVTFIGY